MKKAIIIFILLISVLSCNKKTPEQIAQDRLDKRMQEQMATERKVDSLFKVAGGLNGFKNMKQNRLNALDELKKILPEWEENEALKESFQKIQDDIYNYR